MLECLATVMAGSMTVMADSVEFMAVLATVKLSNLVKKSSWWGVGDFYWLNFLDCFSDSLVFGSSVIVTVGLLVISSCFGCCFIAKSFCFFCSCCYFDVEYGQCVLVWPWMPTARSAHRAKGKSAIPNLGTQLLMKVASFSLLLSWICFLIMCHTIRSSFLYYETCS